MQHTPVSIRVENINQEVDSHMVCSVCEQLAVWAPMLSCGERVCRTCCLALVTEQDEHAKPTTLTAGMLLHNCPCGEEFQPCMVDAPLDKSLVREIHKKLLWVCSCYGGAAFSKLDVYETHVLKECPDRLVVCKWCSTVSSYKDEHEMDCAQRRVECWTCSMEMLATEFDAHRVSRQGHAETGCKGATACDACHSWFKGTTAEAISAHFATCIRQIVTCDACQHVCLSSCLAAHRESDVVCLRKQRDQYKAALDAYKMQQEKAKVEAHAKEVASLHPATKLAKLPTAWV
jgi:hypothetical protein